MNRAVEGYCAVFILSLAVLHANNSKENRRHNVHKHLAAVLCIIPNQNGGYEAEPQLLLGSL